MPKNRKRKEYNDNEKIIYRSWEAGVVNIVRENFDKAIDHFKIVLELNPNHHQALSELATVYFKQKKYQQAIGNYTRALQIALQIGENAFYIYFDRAYAYYELKQHEYVFSDWIRAYQLDPNFPKLKEDFLGFLKKFPKKDIFTWIKNISSTEADLKISVLKQALDENTILGKRFKDSEFLIDIQYELKHELAIKKDLLEFNKKYDSLPSIKNSFFSWNHLKKVDLKEYEQTENEILDNEKIFKL